MPSRPLWPEHLIEDEEVRMDAQRKAEAKEKEQHRKGQSKGKTKPKDQEGKEARLATTVPQET
jgi:hypothetical protein